jgi:LysM repeat protein
MTPDRPNPASRPEHNEPWRMERMVQRVPAHLGETTNEPASGWLVIAGIVLLIVVSCGVLFILLNMPERLKGFSIASPPTATRTRVVTPAVTAVPATLPPPSPTPGPTAVTTKYKVKSGDTLIMIASRYKVSVQAIMTANGLIDETIRIGDELIIPLATPTPPGGAYLQQPPAASISTTTAISLSASSPPAAPAATPGMLSHKVARGDTLISIAATYGSTVDAIKIANQLDGDFLSIGQVLQIPVGAWTPTPLPTSVAMVSPTPTAQFAYGAPNLMWPQDKSVLHGTKDAPTLSWIAAGALKSNEVYVVHIDYSVDGISKPPIVAQVRQGNSFKLDSEKIYPGTSQNGAQFSWYVMIVNQDPRVGSDMGAETRGAGIAASPPSPTWSFTWY